MSAALASSATDKATEQELHGSPSPLAKSERANTTCVTTIIYNRDDGCSSDDSRSSCRSLVMVAEMKE
eukprot:scaffold4757_cov93-Skeletonema_dohrnii-CCMP3373.AAC.5